MIAALAASGVALFQLNPSVTTGTTAAANMPQDIAPIIAIRSEENKAKTAANTVSTTVVILAVARGFEKDLPIAAGISCMTAAVPILKNASAVDIIAAKRPAKTIPANKGCA